MRSRNKYIVVISWFVALVSLPLLLHLLGHEGELQENRTPHALPELRITHAGDRAWYSNISGYLEDHLPLRQYAVKVNGWLNLRVFKETSNTQVSLGKDGWLFYNEGLYQACVNRFEIHRIMHALVSTSEALEHEGTRVVWVIAPNKEAIYPEKLTYTEREASGCALKNRVAIRELLREENVERFFVDLFTPIETEKPRSRALLYRQYDTHWTYRGASVAAQAIINFLEPELWEEESLTLVRTINRSGDLSRMSGLDLHQMEDVVITQRPDSFKQEARSCLNKQTASKAYEMVTPSDTPIIGGRTVFLHDSFAANLQKLLRPYFAESEEVHFDHFNALDSEETLRCANMIVVETTERHFLKRAQDFLAAFGAETPAPVTVP